MSVEKHVKHAYRPLSDSAEHATTCGRRPKVATAHSNKACVPRCCSMCEPGCEGSGSLAYLCHGVLQRAKHPWARCIGTLFSSRTFDY